MTGFGAPAAPERIVVAGDWHGNRYWALNVIRRLPQLLAGERNRVILHLGDFGIWPDADGRRYLSAVSAALAEQAAELWFVDGNHEDFSQLEVLGCDIEPDGRVPVRAGIYHLPRGHRWAWHGRRWLACGGGVSLDRAGRREGSDWWPQEEITDAQERALASAGVADVMVCHDCPAAVTHSFPRPPADWNPADLRRNDAHRVRLQRITEAVRPRYLMHGHLHRAYQRDCEFDFGPVQVTGLPADGALRNFAVLDARSMTWRLHRRGLLGRLGDRRQDASGASALSPAMKARTAAG